MSSSNSEDIGAERLSILGLSDRETMVPRKPERLPEDVPFSGKIALKDMYGKASEDEMFFIDCVQGIGTAMASFTAVALLINLYMKEYKHPDFDSKMYMLELYQSFVSMTVSGIAMETTKYFVPGVFYSDPLEQGALYLVASSVGYILMFDTLNYWMHRMFHMRIFYSRFHALHHQFRPVMGSSSAAISVIDSLVVGQIPVWIPLYLLSKFGYGLASVSFYASMTFILVWSMYLHAIVGHNLSSRIFVDNSDHLKHHHLSRCNYGNLFRFWDWFCGTQA